MVSAPAGFTDLLTSPSSSDWVRPKSRQQLIVTSMIDARGFSYSFFRCVSAKALTVKLCEFLFTWYVNLTLLLTLVNGGTKVKAQCWPIWRCKGISGIIAGVVEIPFLFKVSLNSLTYFKKLDKSATRFLPR